MAERENHNAPSASALITWCHGWIIHSLLWLLSWCLVPQSDLVPLVAVLEVVEGSAVVLCAMVGALQWCFSCCFG